MKLTILRNDAAVPPGHLARVAQARGIAIEFVALDAGASLPALADVDALAVLGGEMGAYDTDVYPYLADEKRYLKEAVEANIPVLGLCLGCQLLADALGGRAYLAEVPEVDFAPLRCVVDDPVVDVLGTGPSVTMHRDVWDAPAAATILAVSDRYDHAFRLGTALAVQAHPEVTHGVLAHWITSPGGVQIARDAGVDGDRVLERFREAGREPERLADRFFGKWLDEAIEVDGRRRNGTAPA